MDRIARYGTRGSVTSYQDLRPERTLSRPARENTALAGRLEDLYRLRDLIWREMAGIQSMQQQDDLRRLFEFFRDEYRRAQILRGKRRAVVRQQYGRVLAAESAHEIAHFRITRAYIGK